MPWTKVKHLGDTATKSGATTSTITLTGTVPIGNQVVVFAHGLTQSTSIASCADSRGNTYTRFFDLDVAVGRQAFFVSTLTTALQIGDTITVTYAASVNTRAITVDEWSGGTDDIALAQLDTGQTAPSAAHMVTPALASVAAGDLVVGLIAASNATDVWAPTPDTNYALGGTATTGITSTNRSLAILTQVAPSSGTYTPGLTNGANARSYDGISFSIAAPVTGGATVTGAAALTGAGSLTSSGVRKRFGVAALSGVGSLTSAGVRKRFGVAALTGVGTLASAGVRTRLGIAALSGVGSLITSGVRARAGASSLSGAGTLSAAGTRKVFGAATLDGWGDVEAAGVRSTLGGASLAGIGSLTSSGLRTVLGVGILAGVGGLGATGYKISFGGASLSGLGSLSSEGLIEVAGVTFGRASLSGLGSLAATPIVARIGRVTLSGSGSVSAAGSVGRFGSADLLGVGGLVAFGRSDQFGGASLSGVGSLVAGGRIPTRKTLRSGGSSATFGKKLKAGDNPSMVRTP